MSLPHEPVFSLLRDDFVVGWRNVRKEDFVGYSGAYHKRQSAVGTTNGAGPHNLQIFVLSPDGIVLHALAGFWHPADLAHELRFAKVLFRLWTDEGKTLAQKRSLCRRLQLREPRNHPAAMQGRCTWQSFDSHTEARRLQTEARDTVVYESGGKYSFKPLNVLLHERMAKRPFMPFSEFDTAAFVDYGRYHYDLNWMDRGKRFRGQKSLMRKRARRGVAK